MCPLSGVERFPLLGGFQCQWESDRDQSINRGYTVHIWFFMLNDIDWQCVRCSTQLYTMFFVGKTIPSTLISII